MHAPDLVDLEVASVVRRRALTRAISSQRGREALEDLSDLRISRYGSRSLLPRIWGLRDAMTVYDASYVALAEALDAALVTTDDRLARTAGRLVATRCSPG